jgi:hypothetical protein
MKAPLVIPAGFYRDSRLFQPPDPRKKHAGVKGWRISLLNITQKTGPVERSFPGLDLRPMAAGSLADKESGAAPRFFLCSPQIKNDSGQARFVFERSSCGGYQATSSLISPRSSVIRRLSGLISFPGSALLTPILNDSFVYCVMIVGMITERASSREFGHRMTMGSAGSL